MLSLSAKYKSSLPIAEQPVPRQTAKQGRSGLCAAIRSSRYLFSSTGLGKKGATLSGRLASACDPSSLGLAPLRGFAALPSLTCLSILATEGALIFPKYSPSATTIGARAQAPRQLTVSKENSRSEVVSPDLTPNLRSTSSKISAA